MKRLPLWCFLSALVLGACTVPSLKELEQERKRECDADHACLAGYVCVNGLCEVKTNTPPVDAGNPACTAGQTQSCGSNVGECVAGTQSCGEDGGFGPCVGEVTAVQEICDGKDNDCDGTADDSPVSNSCGVNQGVCAGKTKACVGGVEEAVCSAVSFGPDYQATETSCDGKDNDCDGQTDESLTRSCPLDAGVCAGAVESCSGGAFSGCTVATYQANNAAYEPYEGSCDGLDNDCDGLTDSWNGARVVSDAGVGVVRRAAVGAASPDAGTANQADLLLFYEDGPRVTMRARHVDGTLSVPTAPAASVNVVARAWGPAIASDGTNLVAGWFDQLGSGGSATYRLQLGLPRNTGESYVNGAPGAVPVTILPGEGHKLSLAAAGGRIGVAYSYLDSASMPRVAVANCPVTLTASCGTVVLTTSAAIGDNPSVGLSSDGATLAVAYEIPGGGFNVAIVTGTTSLTVQSDKSITTVDTSPALRVVGTSLEVYAVKGGNNRLNRRSCTLPCNNMGSETTVGPVFSGPLANLAIAEATLPTAVLGAVEVLNGTVSEIHLTELSPTNTTENRVSDPAANAFRPWLVNTARTSTGGLTVLWDTEGATGTVTPDVIWAQRQCL